MRHEQQIAYQQQPHAGEMPVERIGDARIHMRDFRQHRVAAQGRPDRETVIAENRLGIVNPPAAADHHDNRQSLQPMRNAHQSGMFLNVMRGGRRLHAL